MPIVLFLFKWTGAFAKGAGAAGFKKGAAGGKKGNVFTHLTSPRTLLMTVKSLCLSINRLRWWSCRRCRWKGKTFNWILLFLWYSNHHFLIRLVLLVLLVMVPKLRKLAKLDSPKEAAVDSVVLAVKSTLANNKWIPLEQQQQQQMLPPLQPFDLHQMSFVFITLAIFQSHFLSFNKCYNCWSLLLLPLLLIHAKLSKFNIKAN